MAYCKKCGVNLSESDKFCGKCGTSVSETNVSDSKKIRLDIGPGITEAGKKVFPKIAKMWWFVAILIVVVLLFMVVVVFKFFSFFDSFSGIFSKF